MVWKVEFADTLSLEDGCVVAIGNFDGVHAGHRAVLEAAKEEAMKLGVPVVALTFEPHPRSVLVPEKPLQRLTTAEEKVRLLGEAGADGVAVVNFDLGVARWSAEDFIQKVLVGWLAVKCVCVGENFRFGHKASGDLTMLRGQKKFTTRGIALMKDAGGETISSRRLRDGLIEE